MNDVQTQINQAKETLKNYKQQGRLIENDRLTAQAQLNQLHLHEKEILEQCKSLGYQSRDELNAAISDKMEELNETLEKLNRMLRGEIVTYEQVQAEKVVKLQSEVKQEEPTIELTMEETESTPMFDFSFDSPTVSTTESLFDFNSLFNSEGE